MRIFTPGIWIIALCLQCSPFQSRAYSVLTHEAVVDAGWERSILPLLKNKFPGVTDSALQAARSYAYGGAIAPDMGYFPFGSHLFTDLVHYVRSGDLVAALFDEAQDLNEYAFALGFLCHYMSDKYGHFIAINRSVPMVYPKLRTKYGDVVTYEQHHTSHRRVEFSFDVLQTAKGNYASRSYHDFIGFNVSRPLLERAFVKVYGLKITDIYSNLSLSIETFRWSVRSLFPALTRAAWVLKKDDIKKLQPTATSRSFNYKMSRANYFREFGREQKRPGFFANLFAGVIFIIPKVGPFKSLKFKAPGPEAEKLFIRSFDTVVLHCASAMKTLNGSGIQLANIDFDTGNKTAAGEYNMADINYGKLLIRLSENKFEFVSDALRKNILAFYDHPNAVEIAKKDPKEWKKISLALEQLKQVQL